MMSQPPKSFLIPNPASVSPVPHGSGEALVIVAVKLHNRVAHLTLAASICRVRDGAKGSLVEMAVKSERFGGVISPRMANLLTTAKLKDVIDVVVGQHRELRQC